jgi:hypothetical protein
VKTETTRTLGPGKSEVAHNALAALAILLLAAIIEASPA